MEIVSTTLAGNNEGIIRDALKSVVDWVDACLVIDTGATDATMAVADEVAGGKLMFVEWPWADDFAKARNFALESASTLGFKWAITLDTDERILPQGDDIRSILLEAPSDVGAFNMRAEGGTYDKPRCIRLPARAEFRGAVHEAFPAYTLKPRLFEKAEFRELAKTPEQIRSKAERDLRILTRLTETEPTDPRWHYYMGESFVHLNRLHEAIASYKACSALRGWPEESAWACYRAAECFFRLNDPLKALEVCCQGLERHSGITELAWLAGFACYQLKRFEDAVSWARMAAANGYFRGSGALTTRIGFRFWPGLYEGPYDVLRFALKHLNRHDEASVAEVDFTRAKGEREALRR